MHNYLDDQSNNEILLVEDNPEDIELTLRALKKNNLANPIQVVMDGQEALDYLFAAGNYRSRVSARLPRVILLDIKLPKRDGLEVLKIIKQDPRTRLVPVVMLTSSQQEQDIVESYRLGVNSFITKPVEFDKFIEVVHELEMYWLLLNKPFTS